MATDQSNHIDIGNKMVSKKSTIITVEILISAFISITLSATAFAIDTKFVRERGQSVPPFLNPGVKPNLLLLIDNSGSMLDMAYTDEDTDGTGPDTASYCTDATFNTASTYTGYFEENSWYKWDDSGVTYWRATTEYKHGQLIYDNGIVYEADCKGNTNCFSGSSSVLSDNESTTIEWLPITDGNYADTNYRFSGGKLFQSGATPINIDEGAFVLVSDGTQCDGAAYRSLDVCISVDESTIPASVPTFAATGNFLNWLSASKFDIEKKILTGGKFNEDANLLISEHRGCAGSGFIKEVTLTDVYDGITNKNLSIRVRGPIEGNSIAYKNDKISKYDNTTRIEILALTDAGDHIINEYCQSAIDDILANANLTSLSNDITRCLAPLRAAEDEALADQRPMLNHALQFCQKFFSNDLRDLTVIINECETLYQSLPQSPNAYLPSEINPYYGGYACYGIYDSTVAHAERTGYVGRCWNPSAGLAGTCTPKTGTKDCTLSGKETTCEYEDTVTFSSRSGEFPDYTLFKNHRDTLTSPIYNYVCTNVQDHNGVKSCKKEDYWVLLYVDDSKVTHDEPTCGDSSGSVAADWDPTAPDPSPAFDDTGHCVLQGIKDYCGDLAIPEVIDPSDQATTTSEFWNAPATLIDSAVVVALGTDRPLAVIKGHIKQSKTPTGVLHRKAQNLNIGAMKFNAVGADYECDQDTDGTSAIRKFCPEQNEDGARLVSPIQLGSSLNADNKVHVYALAEAINDVQADTWTPLAEAVYSAIGYITQRSDMCLNFDASGVPLDFPVSSVDDPVTQPCQPNHLLIITEGASTSDINNNVAAFAAAHSDGDADTNAAAGTCTDGLQGSTYLDDLTAFGYYDKPAREEFTSDTDYEAAYAVAEIDADSLYLPTNSAINGEIKEGIITHIITTGSLESGGTGECNPETIMSNAASQGGSDAYVSGENPTDFENGLNFIFESILERASAGSAASVISSSRSGEGAVYQAIFWPELKRTDDLDNEYSINWVGEVHSLFIDSKGYLYEDTPASGYTSGDGKLAPLKDLDLDGKQDIYNEDIDGDNWLDVDEDLNGNGVLDAGEDVDCDNKLDKDEDIDGDGILDVAEEFWSDSSDIGTDRRVIIYFDSTLNKSRGCYKFEYTPVAGDTCLKTVTCTDPIELEEINYIWSANQWLSEIPDSHLLANRPTYMSDTKQRYIFTWNDLNNNGIVDHSYGLDDGTIVGVEEIIPFEEATNWNHTINAADNRGPVPNDFGMLTDSEVDNIINWMRGHDTPGVYRERKIPKLDDSSQFEYWRLGDVIHSTPMTVAAPAENFDQIYGDETYAVFAAQYDKRRHVIYFGANDGMLHAVNGGFYNDAENKFYRGYDKVNKIYIDSGPELGAELWAYVPYNLQPHLEFLADPNYIHKYYVDLRPRIFDVQIFPADGDHPRGWGTILVGGMRFGGAPVHAEELNGNTLDNRVFASSYFVFDITNPEKPPVLLGEITRKSEDVNFDNTLDLINEDDDGDSIIDIDGTDLGYSTSIPTMIIMKETGASVDSSLNRWYLTLGSGPHSYFTATDSKGDRALKGFSDQTAKVAVLPLDRLFESSSPIRIPDSDPTESDGGRFLLSSSANGFVSDLITVDFDIAPSANDYMADAVYFGTVEANTDDASGGFLYAGDGSATWNGGGKMYRLRTRDLESGQSYSHFVQKRERPYVIGDYEQGITTPDQWEPTILFNPGRPVTGAASVAYDGINFWVYFGTGRFFDSDDKSDATQQYYFGIKEPLESITVGADDIYKFTWPQVPISGTSTANPGHKGLLKVDEILVQESNTGYAAELSCRDNITGLDGGGTACLPAEIINASGEAFLDSYNGPSLLGYTAGEGDCTAPYYRNCSDGWYKAFYDYNNRERNLGQATVLGGLVTFTTYQPYSEPCLAEGVSYLYGVYYQTGTAWYENVFGINGVDYFGNTVDKLILGRGLSTTPNLHVGSDAESDVKAFIQTSTGEIREVEQTNLPIKTYKTGIDSWKEYERP